MLKQIALGVGALVVLCGAAFSQGVELPYGPGSVPCAYTLCTVTGINATTLGSATAVNFGFNGAKTGFYSTSQDANLAASVNGSILWDYAITSAGRMSFTASVQSSNAAGWIFGIGAASATSATFSPNRGSTNTGIGAQASGNMSFIAGGVEEGRITSNGLVLSPSNVTATAWTTTGVGLVQSASTVTDSSSTGTVASVYLNMFGSQTIAATNAGVTFTSAYGNVFNSPGAGANVTLGASYSALFNGTISINGGIIATNANSYRLISSASSGTVPTLVPNQSSATTGWGAQASGNMSGIANGVEQVRITSNGLVLGPTAAISAATWTTTGIGLVQNAVTYTDTTVATGTTANVYFNVFGINTLAATNSGVTFTNAYANVFNPPTNGTNVTIPNKYAALFNGQISLAGNNISSVATITGSSSTGPQIFGSTASSSTVPTIIPQRSATTTGLGGDGTNLYMILAGTNQLTIASSGITTVGTATIGTVNSATGLFVCETSGLLSSGITTCVASDKRVKNDLGIITPEKAVARIMALPDEHRFTYKLGYGPPGDHTGWWAQDIQKVWPGVVYKGKKMPITPDGELTFDRGEIGPDTTTAVKFLVTKEAAEQTEIASLKSENEHLRAANDNFNRRLTALETHRKLTSNGVR